MCPPPKGVNAEVSSLIIWPPSSTTGRPTEVLSDGAASVVQIRTGHGDDQADDQEQDQPSAEVAKHQIEGAPVGSHAVSEKPRRRASSQVVGTVGDRC